MTTTQIVIPYETWARYGSEWVRVSASPDLPDAEWVDREVSRDQALYLSHGADEVRFALYGDRTRFDYNAAEFISLVRTGK